MNLRIFGWSYAVTAAALVVAFVYGGVEALVLCAILGVLEISLSFDNAVVNATVLERMSAFWQRIFLTVGIVIAVFGMRLVFPLLIVGITANLNPVEAFRLALEQRPESDPTSYAHLLNEAYPSIAAFGGMFLLMLFLDWLFAERDVRWLSWLERPLARIGQLNRLSIILAVVALVVLAGTLAADPAKVLVAGTLGLVTYLLVNGLGDLFEQAGGADAIASSGEEAGDGAEEGGNGAAAARPGGPSGLAKAAGKAGFFLFLYLEVLDAAFSFDGVIGAFAITTDPIIIALGLGLIGAMFVRSLTVFLVRKGTLADYVYLEHGAHWAIGALSVILLVGIGYHVDEVVTGLIGVAFIGAAFVSSVIRNRRLAARGIDTHRTADEMAAGGGHEPAPAEAPSGSLTVVRMGLGWDAAEKALPDAASSQVVDLDASALLFDEAGELVDAVWYQQLESRDGSVRHTGDNLTGLGDGDDESIVVDLTRLAPTTAHVVFTVNSFTGQDFSQIENAFVRVVDEPSGAELARYDLSGSGSHNAQITAKLSRDEAGEWRMTSIGATATGRTVQELVPATTAHL
ncbi:DUF475 domain-containing protein [Pseudonocardia benzenivorans]|uniref:DUF475 domain-containing protein n=1 Tax=Pseudonocardia benzenivorans TaxID=228005 RepID=A0ABW3VT02_9PSEU